MPEFSVPQETIEAGLLAAINQDVERYLALESSGLSPDDFVAHKQVYLFIKRHLADYGVLPTNALLASQFQWQPTAGEFAYWLKEMKRYALAQKLLATVNDIYQRVEQPEEALSLGLERFALLRAQSTNGHAQATDAGAQERYVKYLARQQYLFKSNQVLGLLTGIEVIDATKQGWMPGELIGMYARPSVGKTWWLLWQGVQAWLQKKRVLAITPEMPTGQLNIRIDVVTGAMLGYPLNYTSLLAGDPSQQVNYQKVTEEFSSAKRWWTYDSLEGKAIGLGELSALIHLHNPDLLLIDGISLLRSDNGRGQTWEQMKETSYGLKTLATINDLPVIVTHQATRPQDGRRKEHDMIGRGDDFTMPSLNDAAYGDAFVQACSTIFTMVGDKELPWVQWYSIRKHRERGWAQPLPVRMGMAWDPGSGRIVDLGKHGHSPEIVRAEASRILGLGSLH